MTAGPPILLVRVELEELPVAIVIASTEEDERRLRLWLSTPAVEDALDQLAGRRAAW